MTDQSFSAWLVEVMSFVLLLLLLLLLEFLEMMKF